MHEKKKSTSQKRVPLSATSGSIPLVSFNNILKDGPESVRPTAVSPHRLPGGRKTNSPEDRTKQLDQTKRFPGLVGVIALLFLIKLPILVFLLLDQPLEQLLIVC